MFIGRYYHTLETNGRVSLPKTFREQEAEWIITRGLDGGLFGFRVNDFEERIRELSERTFTQKSNRDFVRLMTNDAQHVSVDSNGRVQLPEYLIEFAHLKKDLVIVGSFNWIEVWDREDYHQYIEQVEERSEEIAETLETGSHVT